jgi:hypothetical protein
VNDVGHWQNVGLADLGASIKDLRVLLTSHFSLVNIQKSEQERAAEPPEFSEGDEDSLFPYGISPQIYLHKTIRKPDPLISLIFPEENMFRFDAASNRWIYNLGTKQFAAAGTYEVAVPSGNNSEYTLGANGACTQVFERLP